MRCLNKETLMRLVTCAVFLALLLSFSPSASAQVGELRGRVLLKQQDGSLSPLEGATVDLLRTDIAAKYETVTNKSGVFIYAGVLSAGVYILSVSAPNARPAAIPEVFAGEGREYEVTLEAGDGQRLTAEEARAIAYASQSNSSDDEKPGSPDEIANRAFNAGNNAFRARRYDKAIEEYDKVLTILPNLPPVWINKAFVFRSRGMDAYNAALISPDPEKRRAGMEAARKDFSAAVEAAAKAVESVRTQLVPTKELDLAIYNRIKAQALYARAESMRLLVLYVDASRMTEALMAARELIDVETDPAKKTKARLDLAKMLLDVNALDDAIEEYRGILATEPENIDAAFGLGFSLYATGDKKSVEEAAGLLKALLDKVPDTHPLKATVIELLESTEPSGK